MVASSVDPADAGTLLRQRRLLAERLDARYVIADGELWAPTLRPDVLVAETLALLP